MTRTAAALVIGNEVLTGKVQEQNLRVLAQELFRLGISLRACRVCPDEEEAIVRDVRELSSEHDYLFTSGGIGPTHDDITIASVALALNRPVIRSTEIAERLREHHGDATTETHLRMANIPEHSELLFIGRFAWPVIKAGNVFILPGVPKAFQWKVEGLREHLDLGDRAFNSVRVYTTLDEASITPILDALNVDHPDVEIGSYVRWGHPTYKVMVTFDGRDPHLLEVAASDFRQRVGQGNIVPPERATAP